MRILFLISVLSFATLLWAALAMRRQLTRQLRAPAAAQPMPLAAAVEVPGPASPPKPSQTRAAEPTTRSARRSRSARKRIRSAAPQRA